MKVLRSIGSVVISYVVVYLFIVLSDPLLSRLFPGQYVRDKVPPTLQLLIGTAIFAVASMVGGMLCVRIAPAKPGIHLLVLFAVGEIAGVISAVAIWKSWPHWYSIAWLALWPVGLWIGGLGRKAKTPVLATVGAS
jgi:hypothetical protein